MRCRISFHDSSKRHILVLINCCVARRHRQEFGFVCEKTGGRYIRSLVVLLDVTYEILGLSSYLTITAVSEFPFPFQFQLHFLPDAKFGSASSIVIFLTSYYQDRNQKSHGDSFNFTPHPLSNKHSLGQS